MIQTKNIFKMFAILLAGACMAACSGSDDGKSDSVTPQPNPQGGKTVILTGSLSAKNGETTRAVDADGNTQWVVGEKIGVIYRQANDQKALAEATITLIRSAQHAEYTATLTNVTDGAQTVDIIYPYTLATTNGYDKDKLLNNQKGTIEDISANWDLSTGNGRMTVSGSTATLPTLMLKNQLCICNFTLVNEVDDTQYDFDVSTFKISDGTNEYTITPASATNELTVAMLPVTNASFAFTGKSSVLNYQYSDGKALSAVNASDVGRVIAADGKAYKGVGLSGGEHAEYTLNVSSATLAANRLYSSTLKMPVVNPVAIIAYVGNDTAEPGYTHGLALSLKTPELEYDTEHDNPFTVQWKLTMHVKDNAVQYAELADALAAKESGRALSSGRATWNDVENKPNFPAFYVAINNTISTDTPNDGIAKSAPAGTSGWFLPSIFQWNQMINGLTEQTGNFSIVKVGDESTYKDNYKNVKYNNKIIAVGGDELDAGGYYSSSEHNDDTNYNYNSGMGGVLAQNKNVWSFVRAAFAF